MPLVMHLEAAVLDTLRSAIRASSLAGEAACIIDAREETRLAPSDRTAVSGHAAHLVRAVRGAGQPGVMEAFLAEYGLSTKEGVALMCLAETLLRVPDTDTIDELIQDKIVPNDWGAHIGDSGSLLVNASTWALLLTGRVLEDEHEGGVVAALHGMMRRLGEPVIRAAVGRAMRDMGAQFVLGREIREAIERGDPMMERGYVYSYDMLGEAARTEQDAMRYHGAYAHAIAELSRRQSKPDMFANAGISVKLSALHPRYEYSHRASAVPALADRTLQLARAARDARIGFNIDAEESDRLELSLDIIEAVLSDPSLDQWDGFGVVVQTYGPRAVPVLDWLYALTERLNRRIMVRLVKGAYWDSEIKRAQALGIEAFPVFTRKAHTDINYLACARKLLDMRDRIYPQFATHNAHTASAVLHMAGEDRSGFEFQRLHGMGEALHEILRKNSGVPCRVYAPVGAHRDLLAYLVRRLLENGANSSFVHQIVDESVPPEAIARDPIQQAGETPCANPIIIRPSAIFGPARPNARGWDLTDPDTVAEIEKKRARFASPHRWRAGPTDGISRPVLNPANLKDVVGDVFEATPDIIRDAIDKAVAAAPDWSCVPIAERAAILRRIADLYELHAVEFFALTAREAGKTLADGVAEVREAVDFLRYYASEAEELGDGREARGTIVCISPWNFPLAIFTGQIAAGLVTGNTIIAKPAEQTSLIAARAVALMHEAGLPDNVVRLVLGDGQGAGAPLTADPRISGVCFTGSTEVAKRIEGQLAETAPGAMLIAETGGLNAMIVDSTALPEQAVRDILTSAFQSAGQRCSALRVLYLQRDMEDRVLGMLFGAMEQLKLGDPWALSSDLGPVIDSDARDLIVDYCRTMADSGRLLKQLDAPANGMFVPPAVVRVNGIGQIEREIFGPVLHVARFDADRIDDVLEEVNTAGYGLTFGLHTRIDRRVQQVVDTIKVGNLYVNRNQIGAVVGSQPFGGEGLSGTGPKAGGPHYLPRFRRSAPPPANH
jgi:RHH-type transcriptional regulator, proline utilization regulon repressor / proline dehydrogenase / delta 1-pyrroline-5-carboxylate dehydrogenase